MSREKILIVEDEKEIADLVSDYLKDEGYETIIAYDGEQGLQCYKQYKPDLAILDIMLPKMEGTEIARIIRGQSSIPVIMLSAKKSDTDKIISLGLGADDYITKPFSPGELVARVKAQLRRYMHLSSPKVETDLLTYGDLKIHLKNYQVILCGKPIPFSAKEFEVLRLLAESPGQVFTRDQIFNLVWGFNEFGDINTVTVHIKKIREKIEKNPSTPEFVKTVWGVGYKFEGEQI
jgi:two-component system, OmpR family, response regulator VicR